MSISEVQLLLHALFPHAEHNISWLSYPFFVVLSV